MTDSPEFHGFHTRSVHAGARPDPATGSRAFPIHQTTSYVFEDSEAAAAYFNLQEYGNTYSRIMNPTVAAFEERVANLEGAVGGVAFASGLAAQSAALFTLLEPGDHVVASSALYGGTVTQFKHYLRKLSVELDFVDPEDIESWQAAIKDNTKLFFGETIGNPSGAILDIEALADVAHAADIPLMIDNTFATPYLCRPLEFGADIVVHSATKFMGGHGTSIGGVVVESGEFDWSNGRFPVIAEPSPAYHGLKFHETFGTFGYLMKLRSETLRDLGAAMSPFNAFLIAQGIETLPLRMQQHVANAEAIAAHLESSRKVTSVHYAGLAEGRQQELAQKYLPKGTGAVFCFDLPGGRDAGIALIEHLNLFSHLANVGDAKSLVIHPATTTHRQLNDTELAAAGIGPGTIRVSIGIEDANDLIADLDYALSKL
jgi:O-acetylhomoserine (thiol)-lyase